VRLWLSLAPGITAILYLGINSPAAGLVGAAIDFLCALLAYAANAKQVSRQMVSPSFDRPPLSLDRDERTAVMLVTWREPARYDGPAFWARSFRACADRRQHIPHWFLRPWVYRRIRAAYRAMGDLNPTADWYARLAECLQGQLGTAYRVSEASLLEAGPSAGLYRLAAEGVHRVILLPLGQAVESQALLREQAILSHGAEVGMAVLFAPATEALAAIRPAIPFADRFGQLARGLPLVAPPDPPLGDLDSLVALVRKLASEYPG
jgi:hypothetical protein